MGEYTRTVVVEGGATNQLGLVFQWEADMNSKDLQFYVLGGPLASLDTDARPGTSFGGQAGVGFSFRHSQRPILVEIVSQSLAQRGFVTVRGGIQFGLAW